MNKFETMMTNLNLYEEENKKLLNLKQENELKIKRLNEEFETWKNTYELKVQKEKYLLLKEKSKIETKNQKLDQEFKEAPAEKVSREFLNYIEATKNTLNKELQKNIDMFEELVNSANNTIIEQKQQLNKKIMELNSQVKLQEKKVNKAEHLVEENTEKIAKYELEEFLIDYLKQTTGKQFTNMDDKTAYRYEYYEEYSTCIDYFHFIGLKSSNKNYTTFEELIKGIKDKEVILFNVEEERSSIYEHNLFSLVEDYHFSEFLKEKNILDIPYFSFLHNENLEYSYFKIYPDLKEKLLKYIENKFIKEEETKLNNRKKYITNLKNEIDTNTLSMNKEIENTIKNIKEKYAKKLKDNKIEYFQIVSKYTKQKEELETYLNKNKVIKVEENTEEVLGK